MSILLLIPEIMFDFIEKPGRSLDVVFVTCIECQARVKYMMIKYILL